MSHIDPSMLWRQRLRRRRKLAACGLLLVSFTAAASTRGPCDDSLTRGVPAREQGAPTGRQFAARIEDLNGEQREALIRQELLRGNVPDFLRHLSPVRFTLPRPGGKALELIVCAAPDYLAIGSDENFLLIPLRLETALTTAARFGLMLPTPKIVDAIYAQAGVHYVPQPLPAGDQMRSTGYYLHHNDLIETQRAQLGVAPGALSAGDKKDLVLTSRLWRNLDRVAIYGWQLLDGAPIQPLSTVHGWRYVDYSHGARLISDQVFVDGAPRPLLDVLADANLASALSSEGAIVDARRLIDLLSGGARSLTAVVASERRVDYLP